MTFEQLRPRRGEFADKLLEHLALLWRRASSAASLLPQDVESVSAFFVVSYVDVRFEQHCEGAVPALHGKIHWVSG